MSDYQTRYDLGTVLIHQTPHLHAATRFKHVWVLKVWGGGNM